MFVVSDIENEVVKDVLIQIINDFQIFKENIQVRGKVEDKVVIHLVRTPKDISFDKIV